MTTYEATELNELQLVQNPAIGAFLIWHFALGYQDDGAESVAMPLAFLVLPMLLHRPTFDAITATRKTSGLSLFATKFDKERETLVELHSRALLLRSLTLQSIGVGATSKIIRVDYQKATLRSYPLSVISTKMPKLPERLKGSNSAAAKVGYWFSKLSMSQVASILRVDF